MKKYAVVLVVTLLFTTLFLPFFTNRVQASDSEDDSFLSFIGDAIFELLRKTLCVIVTPTGDAFFDMTCVSVGEVVTIDNLVYNKVDKLSINFFDGDSKGTGDKTLTKPLKDTMSPVINGFYSLFRRMAIVVLLVILVYVGIKLLLTSTAEKKADYKSVITCWAMGVLLLIFFPYVMKYTIEVNNVLCTMIANRRWFRENSPYQNYT